VTAGGKMEKSLMIMVQNIINDDDLDSVTLKEFRSVLLHVQDLFTNLEQEEEPEVDDQSLFKKHVL